MNALASDLLFDSSTNAFAVDHFFFVSNALRICTITGFDDGPDEPGSGFLSDRLLRPPITPIPDLSVVCFACACDFVSTKSRRGAINR